MAPGAGPRDGEGSCLDTPAWGGPAQLLRLGCWCRGRQAPQEEEGQQEEPRAHGEAGRRARQPVRCGDTER